MWAGQAAQLSDGLTLRCGIGAGREIPWWWQRHWQQWRLGQVEDQVGFTRAGGAADGKGTEIATDVDRPGWRGLEGDALGRRVSACSQQRADRERVVDMAERRRNGCGTADHQQPAGGLVLDETAGLGDDRGGSAQCSCLGSGRRRVGRDGRGGGLSHDFRLLSGAAPCGALVGAVAVAGLAALSVPRGRPAMIGGAASSGRAGASARAGRAVAGAAVSCAGSAAGSPVGDPDSAWACAPSSVSAGSALAVLARAPTELSGDALSRACAAACSSRS